MSLNIFYTYIPATCTHHIGGNCLCFICSRASILRAQNITPPALDYSEVPKRVHELKNLFTFGRTRASSVLAYKNTHYFTNKRMFVE